jgi:hypothetical protein
VIIKECGCGRQYSRETWSTLRLVGRQGDDDGAIELRDCVCRSTIAVDVRDLRELPIVGPADRARGMRAAAEYLAGVRGVRSC